MIKFIANIFVVLITTFISTSCNTSLERKLMGTWSVEDFYYLQGQKIDTMEANLLAINKNNFCRLPFFRNEIVTEGKWRLVNKNDTVRFMIDAKGSSLHGIYTVHFFKDYDNKLLKVYMHNDTVSFIAAKFLQNFDEDGKDWE